MGLISVTRQVYIYNFHLLLSANLSNFKQCENIIETSKKTKLSIAWELMKCDFSLKTSRKKKLRCETKRENVIMQKDGKKQPRIENCVAPLTDARIESNLLLTFYSLRSALFYFANKHVSLLFSFLHLLSSMLHFTSTSHRLLFCLSTKHILPPLD